MDMTLLSVNKRMEKHGFTLLGFLHIQWLEINLNIFIVKDRGEDFRRVNGVYRGVEVVVRNK